MLDVWGNKFYRVGNILLDMQLCFQVVEQAV
jgi:hypothetical protein